MAQDKANTALMERLSQVEATLATRSGPATPVPASTTPLAPPAASVKDGESQQMLLLMEKLTQLEAKLSTTTPNPALSKKGHPKNDGDATSNEEDEPLDSGDSSQSEGEKAHEDPYITTPSGKCVSLMHVHLVYQTYFHI